GWEARRHLASIADGGREAVYRRPNIRVVRWQQVLRKLGRRAGRVGPPLVGVAALAGIVLAISPASLGRALSRFNAAFVPAILALWVAFYLLQGVRWHLLLRETGARLAARDTVLLNMAGQTIT